MPSLVTLKNRRDNFDTQYSVFYGRKKLSLWSCHRNTLIVILLSPFMTLYSLIPKQQTWVKHSLANKQITHAMWGKIKKAAVINVLQDQDVLVRTIKTSWTFYRSMGTISFKISGSTCKGEIFATLQQEASYFAEVLDHQKNCRLIAITRRS